MLTLVFSALLGQAPPAVVLPPRPHRAQSVAVHEATRYEYRIINGRRHLVQVTQPRQVVQPATSSGGCQIINGVRVCPVQR